MRTDRLKLTDTYGDVFGVTDVTENGLGNASSNSGGGCLRFTSH